MDYLVNSASRARGSRPRGSDESEHSERSQADEVIRQP